VTAIVTLNKDDLGLAVGTVPDSLMREVDHGLATGPRTLKETPPGTLRPPTSAASTPQRQMSATNVGVDLFGPRFDGGS